MDCGIENMGLIVLSFLVFLKFFKRRRIESITTKTAAASGTNSSASASASASAPFELVAEYEVFLSFCGEDSYRDDFIDLLYHHLLDAGIRIYRDDDPLFEEISVRVLKAIKECKISIPIFSRKYASSIRCLRELAYMVECHRTEGQMIFPIFYNVDPSDVRNQRGSYQEAFQQHKKNF